MAKTYVSLDLETTGLNADGDAIIEIGALRFQGDHELETFNTFVNPGRPIPRFVTELTGITDAHVADAPPVRTVVRQLVDFVGRDPIVGHNIGFDLGFLRRHTNTLNSNAVIDTFELAGILVPHAGRYSLANLVSEMGIDLPPQTHRALDDARMAHALFVALLARAEQLPSDVLQEIVRQAELLRWGPLFFFRDAQAVRSRRGFSGGIGAQLAARRGGDAAGPLFLPEEEGEPLQPRDPPLLLDVDALTALLAAGGALAAAFPDYEYRPQQVAMLQAVAQAFNLGQHLLVEAGTGTGKSLAYLLPALTWATQNGQRVVISTNTINLQEQLANKDLPALAGLLPFEFRAMILKGRSHYLCRRQLQQLRQRGPATEDELRVLAKVLLWLPNTLDGDGDPLFLPTPGERAVWRSLSAETENCTPDQCPYFEDSGCFFYRARNRAETAHLLIVNHALLLADVAADNRVLPEYNLLVLDEAHHLERAVTDALRFSVERMTVRLLFEELVRGRAAYPSLLDEVRAALPAIPRRAAEVLYQALDRIEEAAERTANRMEEFFDALADFLKEHGSGNEEAYGVRLRVTGGLRTQPGWEKVELAWDLAAPHFGTLVDGLGRLQDALDDLSAADLPAVASLPPRVLGVTNRLAELHDQLKSAVADPEPNVIYWIEEERNGLTLALNAVPLRVGPLVREHLLQKKRSVVLTSATLRVGGSFDYLRDRLEAWEADELAVGSPFDYAASVLLYVVTDVPEPGQPGHQRAVEQTLTALFEATEGRGLALFTAYSQLQTTAQAITPALARKQITVYTQGSGSSRAQLLANFKRGNRAVLLGTRSFWEGVDVPGEALSCLAIVKLPFDVPNDPIIAARAETYDDPFNEYSVPEAVLRFLQGFGRLIRTKTDRGIVVVLDRRLLTKAYGRRFLDSLPGPTIRKGAAAALPEIAALWLAQAPLPPAEPEPVRSRAPVFEEPPW